MDIRDHQNPFRGSTAPRVPDAEIEIDFVRSGGPGGQNVNKTSTKAQLRWNVDASHGFSDAQKSLIRKRLSNKISKEGDAVLSSESERSQRQNKDAAIRRLNALVADALKPKKKRVPTKPTRGSKERRLKTKKERSEKKRSRRTSAEE